MSTPDPAHSLADLRFALEQDFTAETAEDRTQREQRNLCVLCDEIYLAGFQAITIEA